MNLLRIGLLLLLAALLPVRGVMAAAMLCPPAMPAQAADGGHAAHHVQAELGWHGDAAPAGLGHAAHAGHGALESEKCNLCAACCAAAAPLLSSMPSVAPPHDRAAAGYPEWAAPAPSFVSDGQERPPRRI